MTGVAAFAIAGATLGLAGGLSPGPLTTLVLRESLRGGTRAGLAVSVAPLCTDGPLLVLSALLSQTLASQQRVLGVISLVGAGFLVWLAWESAQTREVAVPDDETVGAGSVLRAVLVNLLNPHPYLFWAVIGGPIVAEAWVEGAASATGFVVLFFATLCGSKVLLAWIVGSHRGWLSGRPYVWTMRLLGLALFGFAMLFVHQGGTLLEWWG